MTTVHDWLIAASTTYPHLVYIAAIVLACVEGPILSVLFGFLLQLGYFNIFLAFGSLMLGDLLGDIIWYQIGYRFGHKFIARFGKYFGMTEEKVAKITDIFHRRKDPILLVSKMTNGFGFALVTLITAGMVKIPFGRYMALNVGGQFIWTGILIATGYFFGNFYATMSKFFGHVASAGLVVIGLALVIGIASFVRKSISDKMK